MVTVVLELALVRLEEFQPTKINTVVIHRDHFIPEITI